MEKETYFSIEKYCGIREKGGYIVHVPVRISSDTLANELEICIGAVSKHGFVSYKAVFTAQLLLFTVIEKLRAYHHISPEEARSAGERMIAILESVETDDDIFPEPDIERIRQIVGI